MQQIKNSTKKQIINDKQIILKIKQSKAVAHLVKESLHILFHQFRSSNYDVNFAIRQSRKQIQKFDLEQQKLCYSILEQYEQFIWHLSVSPKYWIQMLQNQSIHADETQSIDLHLFTSKIYKKICQQSVKQCAYAKQFFEIGSDQIFFFLQEVSLKICQNFARGKIIIQRQVSDVTEIIQKSKIVNFYILYKILCDLSARCYQLVQQQLQTGIFSRMQPEVITTFSHYIIEKHEILDFKMLNQSKAHSQSQKQDQLIKRISNSNQVKWRQAVRQDGQMGILVELEVPKFNKKPSQNKDKQNYMVMLDQNGQIQVMNCNSVRMKWEVCKQNSEKNNILNLIENKQKLAQKLRESPTQIKTVTLMNHVSSAGGSLGKSLANIRKYQSPSDFMLDISKGIAISGSFSYVINTIPLIGYLFVTGGYTISFYAIFSNKFSSFKKKFQQLGNATIDTAASLGSGLLGAFVGQTFIPVPILGAFVGGVIGGFIGQIGGKTISNLLQKHRYKDIIKGLKKTIQPGGYWNVTKQTLDILGLNKQNFFNTIPSQLQTRMNCDRIWLTLICFTLYAFYESKQRKKFMEKSMNELKKIQEKQQNFDICLQDYKQKYEYKPSLDIQCATLYLNEQKVQYLACIQEIEDFMKKMFTRIQ